MMDRWKTGLPVLAATLALWALPTAASAQLEIEPGDITLKILDAADRPDTRAGAHPDRMIIDFQFSSSGGALEDPKDIVVGLPPGLAGNSAAVPFCPNELFHETGYSASWCGDQSLVGSLTHTFFGGPTADRLWSVEPGPNEAALFGGGLFQPGRAAMAPSPDGKGLTMSLNDLTQSTDSPFREATIELWGVPADHQGAAATSRLPMLTTPTRCDAGPPAVTISVHTWQNPDRWLSGSADTGHVPTGCGEIPFDPSAGFALDDSRVDTPTGARIDVAIPQSDDPDGRGSSQVEEMSFALPPGLAISPGGAEGLDSCGDAQLGLGLAGEPRCPASSRVGTVEVATLLTGKPLRGRIFLGESHPGERFRLFIFASGPGAELKTVGSLRVDPQTGQLTTTLREMPQVTFKQMSLHFDDGPGSLLAAPLSCGRATATATLTPYSGTAPVQRSAGTDVAGVGGGACGNSFSPGFSGGSLQSGAGQATAFTTTLSRRDGEQLPERLEIAFPTGISTALGSVEGCADAAATSGSCPAASRIGHALAELGPGPDPARLGGEAFLTGPYKGAPFGLALVFDSKIGPFDLGKMVVRGKIEVDSASGQVTVSTDALPTGVEGIPVRLQTLGFDIDRPGFMHNPTSCGASSLEATVRSTTGAKARASAPFRVRGCLGLPFRPRFGIALRGRSQLHRGGRPGLEISGRVPGANANMRSADVGLPALLELDASELAAICARRDALAGRCPRGARVGSASARTPMLSTPMKGEVYAVQPRGGGSPDVWTSLHGSGLEVTLQGETEVAHGRLTTRLTNLPDFTLSSFSLRFRGGERGVFELKRSPCGERVGSLVAPIAVAGQNGAETTQRAKLATGCR